MNDAEIATWSSSDLDEGSAFTEWMNFATVPYISSTHAGRFATNHVNEAGADAYGMYEDIGTMPEGGVVAKPTFTVSYKGEAELGPLFLMEKAADGSHPDSNDWIYTTILPDGTLQGRTGGMNADAMQMCVACHTAMGSDSDDLLFIPDEFRVN